MATPSHLAAFSLRDLARRCLAPGIGVVAVAATLHAAARWNLLPPPTPGDLDRTVLAAKVDLATSSRPVTVVLLGDSSCMMNVDAPALARRLGEPVLDLGTFSHLDLRSHAALLRHFLRHRAVPPRDVLLLLHPAALQRSSSEAEADRFLRARLSGDPDAGLSLPRHLGEALLGGVLVRERLVQPGLPQPLRSDFGRAYGTTREIRRRLLEQAGSLVDPTRFDAAAFQGRYEFRIGAGLESASREFRAAVPQASRLWVGLMPLPESLALPDHARRLAELRETWSSWLAPARMLDGIPPTRPDTEFATATHLNAAGIRDLTDRLAGAMLADTPR